VPALNAVARQEIGGAWIWLKGVTATVKRAPSLFAILLALPLVHATASPTREARQNHALTPRLGSSFACPSAWMKARRQAKTAAQHPRRTGVKTYRSSRLDATRKPARVMTTTAILSSDEKEFVRLVNEERARRGLRTLTVDPVLTAAARQHSREMAELGYFDHYSPVRGLRSPIERYAVALGSRRFTCAVGENLFYSSRRDVALGHRSLMKSPGHRANILASDYRAIGVGVYQAPSGEYYATQMFHS
jgi:uncharacterized protein YkwD